MPTEEARQNRETRQRVDHLLALFRWVAVALIVGGLAGLGGGALAFVRIGQVVDDQGKLLASVQAERFRNVRRNCLEQNDRHDATIRTLDDRMKMFADRLSDAERRRAQESRAFTVALIDALAPKRADCDTYARDQVRSR